jgi:2-polyprenyl-3-methyl-5-hydroxy-6-metoxy-1,4-benzoquinol methylase
MFVAKTDNPLAATPSRIGLMDRSEIVSPTLYNAAANLAVLSLVPSNARSVLDVGCGAGGNAQELRRRGLVVDGLTFSAAEARLAERWCRRVFLHNCESGLPMIYDDYDCVICSHVLEHIAEPARLLTDIANVLAPSGKLIVALPNLLFYKNRAQLLFGRFQYETGGLMDQTHLRWYTFTSAQELLESFSFNVRYAVADGSVPLPMVRRFGMLKPLCAWLDSFGCRHWPGLFGYQMIYGAELRRGNSEAKASCVAPWFAVGSPLNETTSPAGLT